MAINFSSTTSTELISLSDSPQDILSGRGLRFRDIEEKATEIFASRITHELTLQINNKSQRLATLLNVCFFVDCLSGIAAFSSTLVSFLEDQQQLTYVYTTYLIGGVTLGIFLISCVALKVNNAIYEHLHVEKQRLIDEWRINHLDDLIVGKEIIIHLPDLTPYEYNLLNEAQFLKLYPKKWDFIKNNHKLNDRQKVIVNWITKYRKNHFNQPNMVDALSAYILENLEFAEFAEKYPEILTVIEKDHPQEQLLRIRISILKSNFQRHDHVDAHEFCIDFPSDDDVIPETLETGASCSDMSIEEPNAFEKRILDYAALVDQIDFPEISNVPIAYQDLNRIEFQETLLLPILKLFKVKYAQSINKNLLLRNISKFATAFGLKVSSQHTLWTFHQSIPKGVLWDDYNCYQSLLVTLNELKAPNQVTLICLDGSTIDHIDRKLLIRASPILKTIIGLNQNEQIHIEEENEGNLNPLIENIINGFNSIDQNNFKIVFELASKYIVSDGIVKCAKYFADHIVDMDINLISEKNFPLPKWEDEANWEDVMEIIKSLQNQICSYKEPVSLNEKIKLFFKCFGITTGYSTFYLQLQHELPIIINNWFKEGRFHVNKYTLSLSLISILKNSDPLRNELETIINNLCFHYLKHHLKDIWENSIQFNEVSLQYTVADFCNTPEGAEALKNANWLAIPNELYKLMKH